jgi:TonB family protein
VAGFLPLVAPVSAQVVGSGQVVPVDVVRPVYPAIAVSARVAGDVTVLVRVRSDGGVESAEVVAGPPLLREAALRAVWASRFECRTCGEGIASHTIIFSFRIDSPAASTELTSEFETRVDITAESPPLHILFAYLSVRSPKCLYLWHCGSQWGGMNFYNYPARSGRCAWLWKCGWRRRGAGS